MPPPYDGRSVANQLLDTADRCGVSVTNLALQKLLYFCHAKYLLERRTPLLKGYFEAWRYGPVHPLVYDAFKSCGKLPIKTRAHGKDPITRRPKLLLDVDDASAQQYILEVVAKYGRLSAGTLVDITHAENGPWAFIVRKAEETTSLGLRIPDQVIVERFKYHKVSVSVVPRNGEPDEDAPLTRN